VRSKIIVIAVLSAALAGCGSKKPESASSGKDVFDSAGCANCHTLKAAGANGRVGPDLDQLKPSVAVVTRQVENGGGGMPAFKGNLTAAQIKAVAEYVASNAGK
jgi:cytochrome c6